MTGARPRPPRAGNRGRHDVPERGVHRQEPLRAAARDIAALGGFLFGYDTGVISGALLYMKDDLHLSSFWEATVVSSLLFPGAAFGALFGGRVADRIGRKRSLLVCACLFLVGALGCAMAPTSSSAMLQPKAMSVALSGLNCDSVAEAMMRSYR